MFEEKKTPAATSDDSPASLQAFSKNESRSRELGAYFVKACLLVVIVYLLSLALPKMPSPVVALFWVAFTLVSMLGVLYQMFIRKVHKQLLYPVGSIAAKFNGGRTISIIGSFCLSAVCMASLLLEAPKWDAAEKGIVVLAIVLYPIVECLVGRLAKREFEPAYQTAAKVRWSCVVVAILLCIGYAVWMFYGMSSGKAFNTLFESLINTSCPLVHAESPLLQEAAIGSWITDSATNLGLAQIPESWRPICIAVRVVLCAGAFFGMAHLLGMCSLPWSELKKAFASVDAIKLENEAGVRVRYLVAAAIMSIALFGAFIWVDGEVGNAVGLGKSTALQSLAHQAVATSAYRIGDTYYDRATFEGIALGKEADLKTQVRVLKESDIPSAYDSCNGKVDAFLDWFFSIATNNSVRSNISKENARQTMQDYFYDLVGSDADVQLTKQVNDCVETARELKKLLETGEGCDAVHLEDGSNIPSWLVDSESVEDAPLFDEYKQEAQNVIDAAPASGISKAHNAKQTVLAYQFETFVYSDSRFDSMVSSVEDIAGQGNTASDAFNYVKGMFDKGTQYDGFRSNIEEMLANCRSQTEMLVS